MNKQDVTEKIYILSTKFNIDLLIAVKTLFILCAFAMN